MARVAGATYAAKNVERLSLSDSKSGFDNPCPKNVLCLETIAMFSIIPPFSKIPSGLHLSVVQCAVRNGLRGANRSNKIAPCVERQIS